LHSGSMSASPTCGCWVSALPTCHIDSGAQWRRPAGPQAPPWYHRRALSVFPAVGLEPPVFGQCLALLCATARLLGPLRVLAAPLDAAKCHFENFALWEESTGKPDERTSCLLRGRGGGITLTKESTRCGLIKHPTHCPLCLPALPACPPLLPQRVGQQLHRPRQLPSLCAHDCLPHLTAACLHALLLLLSMDAHLVQASLGLGWGWGWPLRAGRSGAEIPWGSNRGAAECGQCMSCH
jgi:hypothetical protein